MRVIRKRPGQAPQVVEIEPSLKAMQREVDGWIETVTFAENACVVCSEEGRVRGEPFNLKLLGLLFFGTILIVGVDGENFTDLGDGAVEWMMGELGSGERNL